MYQLIFLPFAILGMVLAFYIPRAEINYTGCILLAVAILMLVWLLHPKRYWLCIIVVLFGGMYSLFRMDIALEQQVPAVSQTKQSWLIQVVDATAIKGEHARMRLEVKAWIVGGNVNQAPQYQKLILQDYQNREWAIGSIWEVESRLKAPIATLNPYVSNLEAWALNNGVQGFGSLSKERKLKQYDVSCALCWINQQRHFLYERLDNKSNRLEGIGLMAALGLGFQSSLSENTWQVFRDLGIVHLVSISGLHVTIVATLAALLCRFILRLLPNQLHRPHLWAISFGLLFAGIYAAMAGFSVPTQRSLLMILIAAYFLARRKLIGWWTGWCWALFLVLIWQPMAVLGLGTWLSFGFIAALIVGKTYRLAWAQQNYWKKAWQAQWIASIASVILLGWFVSSLPILSVPVNLVVIPWFSSVLTPLTLLSLLLPFDFLVQFTAYLGDITLMTLNYIHQYAYVVTVPKTSVWMWLVFVVVLILLLLPFSMGFRPMVLIWLMLIYQYEPTKLDSQQGRLTVWDVGQGLSVLFETRNHVLLFDTGLPTEGQNILQLLRAKGITKLDAVVLSHQHDDHTGGWRAIQQSVATNKLWLDKRASQNNIDSAACHDESWEWDGVYFEWLTLPWNQKMNENEQSCVLRIIVQGQAILLTGDLEKHGERALVRAYGDGLYSQILVLGHHGSNSSSQHYFLDKVRPEIAVSSSGYLSRYRHPHPAVLDRLSDRQIELWRTDEMGAVEITIQNEKDYMVESALAYVRYWQRKPL